MNAKTDASRKLYIQATIMECLECERECTGYPNTKKISWRSLFDYLSRSKAASRARSQEELIEIASEMGIEVTGVPLVASGDFLEKLTTLQSQVEKLQEWGDSVVSWSKDYLWRCENIEDNVLPAIFEAIDGIFCWINQLDELDEKMEQMKSNIAEWSSFYANDCRPSSKENASIDLHAVYSSQRELRKGLKLNRRQITDLIERGMPHIKGNPRGKMTSRGRYSVREIIEWARVNVPELNSHWEKYGVSN